MISQDHSFVFSSAISMKQSLSCAVRSKKTNETTKDNDTGDMIKMLQGTGIAEEAENEIGAQSELAAEYCALFIRHALPLFLPALESSSSIAARLYSQAFRAPRVFSATLSSAHCPSELLRAYTLLERWRLNHRELSQSPWIVKCP
jgi:hypothetical protein